MPPKNIEIIDILSGTLYLNDEPIMNIDKCEIVEQELEEFTVTEPKILNIDWTKECTITVENAQFNRSILLSLLLGRKVTNNWLKMHGGVMSRKHIRKERKK